MKKDCFIVNIEFKKWHAIRTSMDDVVAGLRGWRASVGGVLAWVAY